jgi:hypothetical protein
MMTSLKKCIATNALLLLTLLFTGVAAYAAQAVGTVTQLSGPLLAKKADGVVKVLAQQSSVEQGDTLVSEKSTYALIKFIDNSEITLRPNSQFKIENFAFDEAKKENDSAVFSLIKGGLRAVTGMVGKRSKDRFGLNTPTATIGIRGTIFIAEYIEPAEADVAAYGLTSLAALDPVRTFTQSTMTDEPLVIAPVEFAPVKDAAPLRVAQGIPGGVAPRAPGLYVQVLDGMIHLSNTGGSQSFSAGQFGFTPSFKQPPVVLPANPGMQFTPPPSFSSSSAPQGGTNSGNKSGTVDCEIR